MAIPLRAIAMFASLLLPAAALAAYVVSVTLASYRAVDEMRLQSTAKALSAAVGAQLDVYTASLETLAASTLLDDPSDAQRFQVRALPVAERTGGRIAVLGSGPDYPTTVDIGSETVLHLSLPSGIREAMAPALSRVFDLGLPGVSNLFYEPTSHRLMLAVTVPVERPGRARRALALVVEPQALHALLTVQVQSAHTFAAIADAAQRIVASTAPNQRDVVGQAAPPWMAAAVGDRSSTVVVGAGLSGRENVYAVEVVDRAQGWRVTVAQPQSFQAGGARRSLMWFAAGLGAVGLALALAVWLARKEDVRDARSEAAALRAGQASVERLHRGLPSVIFLRDVEEDGRSRLLYRGGDLEAVLGWPARTFDGLDDFRAWTDLSEDGEASFLREVLRTGRGCVEYQMRQPDGSRRWMRVHARTLSARQGGGGEVVGYVQDVSAERSAVARSLAAAQLAALGEISAALVHELRQPLATIAGAAENARDEAQELGAWHIDGRLERIWDQARRASDVLSNLQRFARGAVDATALEDVPLAGAVDRCLELADLALRSASIEVEVDLGGEAAPTVRAHRTLLEQVLLNLVSNAHDALISQPAPLRRCICIRARLVGAGMVRLSVSDTGGGIPSSVLPRLFSPFLTTKAADHGTGLGLWISRALVSGMGGAICARNEAGGAVFEVTLPLGATQTAIETRRASKG